MIPVLSILVGTAYLFAKIELSKLNTVDDRYLSIQLDDPLRLDLTWPDERGFFLELDADVHHSYIYAEFSKHDSYDVRFINSVSLKEDHMVIDQLIQSLNLRLDKYSKYVSGVQRLYHV